MSKKYHKKRSSNYSRRKKEEEPIRINLKVFISLTLLLFILLMRRYDFAIGSINVDSIFDVLYYNEDFTTVMSILPSSDAEPDELNNNDSEMDESKIE